MALSVLIHDLLFKLPYIKLLIIRYRNFDPLAAAEANSLLAEIFTLQLLLSTIFEFFRKWKSAKIVQKIQLFY